MTLLTELTPACRACMVGQGRNCKCRASASAAARVRDADPLRSPHDPERCNSAAGSTRLRRMLGKVVAWMAPTARADRSHQGPAGW